MPVADSPADPEQHQGCATDTPDPAVMRAQEDDRQDAQARPQRQTTERETAPDQLAQATHDEEPQAERQEPPEGCPQRRQALSVRGHSHGRQYPEAAAQRPETHGEGEQVHGGGKREVDGVLHSQCSWWIVNVYSPSVRWPSRATTLQRTR